MEAIAFTVRPRKALVPQPPNECISCTGYMPGVHAWMPSRSADRRGSLCIVPAAVTLPPVAYRTPERTKLLIDLTGQAYCATHHKDSVEAIAFTVRPRKAPVPQPPNECISCTG